MNTQNVNVKTAPQDTFEKNGLESTRKKCVVIVCELGSGYGLHFCHLDVLSGSNSNLWFPLHDYDSLFQEIERIMVMNHQAINITRVEKVWSADKSTDYTITYNVRPENIVVSSDYSLSVTPAGTWGAASADEILLLLNLPNALQVLIRQVLESPIGFPEKAKKVRQMFSSLKNGDHELLRFQAKEIITCQDNLAAGIPAHLKALVERVETEYSDYPNRNRDISVMRKNLLNGDFDVAEFQAKLIATAQTNLCNVKPASATEGSNDK